MAGEAAALVKAAPAAGRGLGWLWKRKLRPDVSPVALRARADELAEAVRLVESMRLDQLGLTRGLSIQVSFDTLAKVCSAGGQDFGSLGEVRSFYDSLQPQRMVVLGDPGAGKTVLALHLLLSLLEERGLEDAPVPVRVNAGSWDGDLPFTDWLVRHLAFDYSVHPRVGRALVDSGRILPFVDGLDEMDLEGGTPTRSREAVDQLNETPWRSRPVVVMCRSETYAALRRAQGRADAGLHLATAVSLSALTAEKVGGYLTECRIAQGIESDEWAPVMKAIRNAPDGPLARALHTPWLLTATAQHLSYGGAKAATELATAHNDDEVRNKVFATMIPAAVAGLPRRRGGRKYTEGQVHLWLQNLADHLADNLASGGNGTDVSLQEIWRIAPMGARIMHGVLVFAILGVALFAGLLITVEPVMIHVGYIAALAVVMGLFATGRPDRVPLATQRPGVLRKELALAMLFGSLTGIVSLVVARELLLLRDPAYWFVLRFTSAETWHEMTRSVPVIDVLAHSMGLSIVLYGFILGINWGLGKGLGSGRSTVLAETDGRRTIRQNIASGIIVSALLAAITGAIAAAICAIPFLIAWFGAENLSGMKPFWA